MNIDKILEKLSDFSVNYAVAAFAVAAFQQNVTAAAPGILAIIFALIFAAAVKK